MARKRPPVKALVQKENGRFTLLASGQAAKKRAEGKCITSRCRNWIPESGRRKHNSRCSKCMMRIWRANNPLAAMLLMWRDRAKAKRVPFDLTMAGMKEFLNGSGYLDLKGRERGCFHLDRIVPKLGYVMKNIQVLTAEANCSKSGKEKRVYGAEDPDPF